jgi:hypothetical protein
VVYVIQRSNLADQYVEADMRFARALFTIRSLVGATVITVLLVGGAIVLLRHPARTTSPLTTPPNNGGVIMEGVDINSNGAGAPEQERHSPPRTLFPPELRGDRHP